MNRRKIVLIGGGSNAWAPRIVKDMMLSEAISDSEFVLYDIDKAASDVVVQFLRRLNDLLKTPATFHSTDSLPTAFDGADYFIITISTGGLDAMAHDLAIPEEYGIRHTVGDTTGPGGWARLLRNFSVFRQLAEDINRSAPGAMVLNYSNPMAPLTRILCDICAGPVVGLCHGLFENLRFLVRSYGLDSEDELSVNYAGLNHFFWITEASARGQDIIADLRDKLTTKSFTDLLRESDPDPMGFKSNRELATELFRLTNVMPYLGDRHTCECFPCYITSAENLSKYKLIRTSIEDRRAAFETRKADLQALATDGEIPSTYQTTSRETAADIISAHTLGQAFIDVGNLPNIGQIANLPQGTVVETAVRVDGNGFSPITFGALPEPVLGFIEPYARVFDLGVEAGFTGDRQLALQALRLDPVCSHLNTEQVYEMGKRLLEAHARFITMF